MRERTDTEAWQPISILVRVYLFSFARACIALSKYVRCGEMWYNKHDSLR